MCILPLLTQAGAIHSQVSHHPPAAAHHVTSQRGWTLWQHITIDSKFRGKYISVVPFGKKIRQIICLYLALILIFSDPNTSGQP